MDLLICSKETSSRVQRSQHTFRLHLKRFSPLFKQTKTKGSIEANMTKCSQFRLWVVGGSVVTLFFLASGGVVGPHLWGRSDGMLMAREGGSWPLCWPTSPWAWLGGLLPESHGFWDPPSYHPKDGKAESQSAQAACPRVHKLNETEVRFKLRPQGI